MTIKLSGSKNHLIFEETIFNSKGLVVSQKLAALPVPKIVPIDGTNPVQYQDITPEQVLANAKEVAWEISGEPVNGWSPYCVCTGELVTEQADELSHHLKD